MEFFSGILSTANKDRRIARPSWENESWNMESGYFFRGRDDF